MLFLRLCLVFLISAPMVLAAQNAVVSQDQSAIRSRPSSDATIIESEPVGKKLRVSSYSKDGWYKTRADSGEYGWIRQANISLLAPTSDIIAPGVVLDGRKHRSRRRRTLPWLFLRAGGLGFAVFPGDVSNRLGLGLSHYYFAPGGYGEIAVRVEPRVRVAARIADYSSSSTVSYNGTPYSVAISGTPLLLGIQDDVSRGQLFDLSLGLYGGWSLLNELTVTATNQKAPNSFSISNSTYAVLLNMNLKYWITHWLAAVGEVGFYYSRIPATQISSAFNGDGPFTDASTGSLSKVYVNNVGPMISIGLELAL